MLRVLVIALLASGLFGGAGLRGCSLLLSLEGGALRSQGVGVRLQLGCSISGALALSFCICCTLALSCAVALLLLCALAIELSPLISQALGLDLARRRSVAHGGELVPDLGCQLLGLIQELAEALRREGRVAQVIDHRLDVGAVHINGQHRQATDGGDAGANRLDSSRFLLRLALALSLALQLASLDGCVDRRLELLRCRSDLIAHGASLPLGIQQGCVQLLVDLCGAGANGDQLLPVGAGNVFSGLCAHVWDVAFELLLECGQSGAQWVEARQGGLWRSVEDVGDLDLYDVVGSLGCVVWLGAH